LALQTQEEMLGITLLTRESEFFKQNRPPVGTSYPWVVSSSWLFLPVVKDI